MSNLPNTRPVVSHFIVAPVTGRPYLSTLCGMEVHATPEPDSDADRCTRCADMLPMLDTARTYAGRVAITPAQAARALNLPGAVATALRGE